MYSLVFKHCAYTVGIHKETDTEFTTTFRSYIFLEGKVIPWDYETEDLKAGEKQLSTVKPGRENVTTHLVQM